MLPIGLMVPSLWMTGDINSALAGFRAMGVTLAGLLALGWRWWPPLVLVRPTASSSGQGAGSAGAQFKRRSRRGKLSVL